MNKVLETINKERVIKKHRRELIQKPTKIVDNEKCWVCKKNLSDTTNSIEIENRKFFLCSPECHGKAVQEMIRGVRDSKKCDYCKHSDTPFTYRRESGNEHTGEKKSFSFCSLSCWEKFREEENEKSNSETNQIKDFSRAYLFAGNEFNQELEQLANQELKNQVSFIDFSIYNNENPEFIETKLKEIYHNSQNQKLIEEGKFPIICFKNIEKIKQNQNLEESLLPVLDKQQNAELFHGKVDLSNFIILTTTSTPEVGKLSDPLISRLEVVNVETVQTKQFFLDKYYYWFLVPSILINLILLALILWPKFTKKAKKNKDMKMKQDKQNPINF